ncbi:speD [Lepeophtheirus salmonis]|uniref:adenosylmethionine decarboxylase n=1 Tax=Lepeophtheirus salmonis TaxID=72036 RepID=A0A7R8CQW2_LEPSM|nr:speD [Lepeophtheirus salmonis]CAF2865669.1 speD [Lepeophtheirus salmonis]
MCPTKFEENNISKSSLATEYNQVSSDDNFFEGVEKLLEVWFTTSKTNVNECDLRKIPRECLELLLENVQCSIVSSSSNAILDAYVLSESSLFVSQRRFILKTCGTTTPLQCLDELYRLVKKYTGFDEFEEIFYSRKNFKKPELQYKPHKSFDQEAALLDKIFPDGSAYCMGSMNKIPWVVLAHAHTHTDCWYLYALNPLDRYVSGRLDEEPDQTIEIIMTELDPEVMDIFYESNSKDGRDATIKSGIDKILPNMEIDDFLFKPCGYSMNGILRNDTNDFGLGEYCTIHITPEPEFSYVSFETLFVQGNFWSLFFSNRKSKSVDSHKELFKATNMGEWVRNGFQYSNFQNYDLTYSHFVRFPS